MLHLVFPLLGSVTAKLLNSSVFTTRAKDSQCCIPPCVLLARVYDSQERGSPNAVYHPTFFLLGSMTAKSEGLPMLYATLHVCTSY